MLERLAAATRCREFTARDAEVWYSRLGEFAEWILVESFAAAEVSEDAPRLGKLHSRAKEIKKRAEMVSSATTAAPPSDAPPSAGGPLLFPGSRAAREQQKGKGEDTYDDH
jgi:hypothetical protein